MMKAWEFNDYAEKNIIKDKCPPDAVVSYAKRHEKLNYIPTTKGLHNCIDESKLSVINMDLAMKLHCTTKRTESRKNESSVPVTS